MAQKSVFTTSYALLREHLVAARHTADMTQEELAEALGRPQSFVSKIEGGERRIDVVELIWIASVVKLDLNALLKALKKVTLT